MRTYYVKEKSLFIQDTPSKPYFPQELSTLQTELAEGFLPDYLQGY